MRLKLKHIKAAWQQETICKVTLNDGDVCVGFIRDFDGEDIELRAPAVIMSNTSEETDDYSRIDYHVTDRLVHIDAVIGFEKDCAHSLPKESFEHLMFYKNNVLKKPWQGKTLKGKLSKAAKETLDSWSLSA